jgi:hypothetical protein
VWGVGKRTECGGALPLYPTGNASQPIPLPRHVGCCRVTPLRSHRAHLADWRSLLLEAFRSPPDDQRDYRAGALCRQAELTAVAASTPARSRRSPHLRISA